MPFSIDQIVLDSPVELTPEFFAEVDILLARPWTRQEIEETGREIPLPEIIRRHYPDVSYTVVQREVEYIYQRAGWGEMKTTFGKTTKFKPRVIPKHLT